MHDFHFFYVYVYAYGCGPYSYLGLASCNGAALQLGLSEELAQF